MAKNEPKQSIEIRVDAGKLQNEVTVDEFIALQEGEIRMIRDVLGRFVVNGNGAGFLDPETGGELVGKLTISQLLEAAQSFTTGAEGAIVKKENEAV